MADHLLVRVDGSSEGSTIVLLSGGLDSSVLVAHQARLRQVHPVYISAGLAWEAQELDAIQRILAAPVFAKQVTPLVQLDWGLRDVYPASHWAVRGMPPAYDTPDEDVYLPGRNIALLSKTAIYAALRGIPRIAVGPLAGNPFPDATPQFFSSMSAALTLGLAASIEIEAPFASLHKVDVIKLGSELDVPLELTLSCMNPSERDHCGRCSKCRERHDAFLQARLPDPTRYATPPPR